MTHVVGVHVKKETSLNEGYAYYAALQNSSVIVVVVTIRILVAAYEKRPKQLDTRCQTGIKCRLTGIRGPRRTSEIGIVARSHSPALLKFLLSLPPAPFFSVSFASPTWCERSFSPLWLDSFDSRFTNTPGINELRRETRRECQSPCLGPLGKCEYVLR